MLFLKKCMTYNIVVEYFGDMDREKHRFPIFFGDKGDLGWFEKYNKTKEQEIIARGISKKRVKELLKETGDLEEMFVRE